MKIRSEIEYQIISEKMIKYGGSFFKLIGQAINKADAINKQKLANAFAKKFAEYETLKDQ